MLGWITALACSSPPEVGEAPPSLSPEERAERWSWALRGRPATAEEAAAFAAGRGEELAATWLGDPGFYALVRDLHADLWGLRVDSLPYPGAVGPLAHLSDEAVRRSLAEEPLALVEEVVRSELPYPEVVTARFTVADATVAAAWGLPFDPAGPSWQRTVYPDGRPMAGILSTNGLLLRTVSSPSNRHRARGRFVGEELLCADLSSREVALVALTEEDVGEATRTAPSCIGCHQTMDPLSAHYAGFAYAVFTQEVARACAEGAAKGCYPIEWFNGANLAEWEAAGPPAASYFGQPTSGLAELGALVAEDERFLRCTTRRVWGWIGQRDPAELDRSAEDRLLTRWRAGGLRLPALWWAVVSDPSFVDLSEGGTGPLRVRPEAWARWVEDRTGFRWKTADPSCAGTCPPDWDLLTTDHLGFRGTLGGVEGWKQRTATFGPSAGRSLALAGLAEGAAHHLVTQWQAGDPAARERLPVDLGSSDPTSVRRELRTVLRAWGQPEALSADLVDVWAAALARSGSPLQAWEVVLAALLQDPEAELY